MTVAGLKKVREAEESEEWVKEALPAMEFMVPAFVREALEENQELRMHTCLAPSQERHFVSWIMTEKKEEGAETGLSR